MAREPENVPASAARPVQSEASLQKSLDDIKEAGKEDKRETTGESSQEPGKAPEGSMLYKDNQRLLSGDELPDRDLPPLIVNVPYGSEPKGIDPKTGKDIVPEDGRLENVDGDDQNADVDAGVSAATRRARNAPDLASKNPARK